MLGEIPARQNLWICHFMNYASYNAALCKEVLFRFSMSIQHFLAGIRTPLKASEVRHILTRRIITPFSKRANCKHDVYRRIFAHIDSNNFRQ